MITVTNREIKLLAGEHGKIIFDELSRWMKNEKIGDEDKVIRELDFLKFPKEKIGWLSLEVYSYYVEMYHSVACYVSPERAEIEKLLDYRQIIP